VYRMPTKTTVYHGTSANFSPHHLESPCWVSTSIEVARTIIDYHEPFRNSNDEEYEDHEKGKRIIEFATTRPLRLLYVESKDTFFQIEDRFGFDMNYPEAMAEAVCRLGYDGWYIEDNYLEGDDTLLCDASVLRFVSVHL
jgi:hypothetical protein